MTTFREPDVYIRIYIKDISENIICGEDLVIQENNSTKENIRGKDNSEHLGDDDGKKGYLVSK